MTKTLIGYSLLATVLCCYGADDPNKRLQESSEVLSETAGTGDKAIPRDLLAKSVCIVVIPSLKKGGFIVAAQYGSGFASCRVPGSWSAPSAMKMEGGSVGFQAGGQTTDIVMLVMNENGMKKLLGSKFALGGEASIAAGPVGRDAAAMTDATMKAEILTYSRAQGLFGGVSLKGSTLRTDEDVNKAIYGAANSDPKVILSGKVPATPAAKEFLTKLNQYGGAGPKK